MSQVIAGLDPKPKREAKDLVGLAVEAFASGVDKRWGAASGVDTRWEYSPATPTRSRPDKYPTKEDQRAASPLDEHRKVASARRRY